MDKIDLFSKIVLRILYIREEGTSMGWEYGKIESLHFLINWKCNMQQSDESLRSRTEGAAPAGIVN